MNKNAFTIAITACVLLMACSVQKKNSASVNTTKTEVLSIIDKVNFNWQNNNKPAGRAFWDVAAYHTGNMEAYFITGNEDYRKYSENWAEQNRAADPK